MGFVDVEKALAGYKKDLIALLMFLATDEGATLAGEAAAIQWFAAAETDHAREAKIAQLKVTTLLAQVSSLMKGGEVVFAKFTPEVLEGLWEVCALGSPKLVRKELPKFRAFMDNTLDYVNLGRAIYRLR